MKIYLGALLLLVTVNSLRASSTHEWFHRTWYSSNVSLEFQYACADKAQLADCRFAVEWRGTKLKDITPKDYKVHSLLLQVHVDAGKNTL